MKRLSLILILAAFALPGVWADETNEAPALDDQDATNATPAVVSNAPPVEVVTPVITSATPPPPASTSSAPRLDIASFRLIWERNIFDPNRSSRTPYVRPVRNEPRRTSRTDSFSLVGTMTYEAGRYAFFDGNSAFYRKVAKPSDTIAGYKVAEVGPNSVKLTASDGKEVVLPVGMQMRRFDEGAWSVAERSEPLGSAPRGTSSYSDQGSDFGGFSTFDRGNFGGGGRRGGGGGGGGRFGGGRNDNGNGYGGRNDNSSYGGRNDNSYGSRNDNGFNRGRNDFNTGGRFENSNNSNDTSRQLNQRPAGTTEPPPVPEGGVTEDNVETPAQPQQNNSSGSGSGSDEALKRLLQKREQELNK